VYRHFPLTQIHPHAESAAEAAEFAGVNGRFWEMHDGIFENQDRLSVALLAELAEELELSAEDLAAALESREFAPVVKAQFLGGVRSGVNGTPTFFINGYRYEGMNEFEDLVEAIDAVLAERQRERKRAG
jgi:protein-disulfide isomerase